MGDNGVMLEVKRLLLGWVLLDGGPPAARRGGPWNGGEPLLDNYSCYSLENVDFWLESNRIR